MDERDLFVADVWDVMARTPQHTYQILTKRPERMEELTARLPLLANVWLGASVENADHLFRIDHLRRVRAARRGRRWASSPSSSAGR